ncbi:DUF3757 domain-containing protein [Yersinia mollaretii]|uniref:DUF3757 domain-containing protein n=1 Tax=Yersinia mollaretii TaxID=33060 RepID=UPI0011A2E3F8|nr:DUF3757 domain-containing protein [Yersinia mollaretii]
MKCKLSFVLLLTPFSVFATLHCPAIDTIKQIGGVYTAPAMGGEEWIGTLQGNNNQFGAIQDFSEALLIIDNNGEKEGMSQQGKFQKCTYNLEAQGRKLDMYYGNSTWIASISGKPHWKHQQTAFFNIYQCSGVAAEECEFDLLEPGSTF